MWDRSTNRLAFQPTWSRRRTMQGMMIAASAIPATAFCAAPPSVIGVPNYRQPGDQDDTASVMRALKAGPIAYFPAGKGSGPDGAYMLQSVSLPAGATIQGDGERSVLRAAQGAMTVFVALSNAPDQTLDNIALRDLRIEGPVLSTGFREHWNLVSMSGVRGVRIDRVQFVGFAGDGLYFGAEYGWPKREPRINQDIVVRDCLFDGVNNDNRNGISVTGGSDITIDKCLFRRCTRPNMPGPIDFEPDPTGHYSLERIRVTNCDFENCGGNTGQIAFPIPAAIRPPQHISITGNAFRKYHGTGGDIVIAIKREPGPSTPAMDCLIEGNVGVGGYSGVQIFSGKGITIRNNRWTGYSSRSLLGFADAGAGVMDVTISDQFDGCGWREGVALAIYKGTGIRVEGNRFTRTGNGGPGSAPIYIGRGPIRQLSLIRNDLRGNPSSPGLMIVEHGANYLPGTTDIEGNLLPEGKTLPVL